MFRDKNIIYVFPKQKINNKSNGWNYKQMTKKKLESVILLTDENGYIIDSEDNDFMEPLMNTSIYQL